MKKASPIVQMYIHSYFEKWNKYISTYKSQCFKQVYDFVLGHTRCSAGPHATRGP